MNFFEHQEEARKASKKLVILFTMAVILIVVLVNLLALAVSYFGFFPGIFSTPSIQNDRTFSEVFKLAWQTDLFVKTTFCTVLLILLASVVKWLTLRGGGSQVAEAMGGKPLSRQTSDPQEKQLLNIIEEMSIASGVPVPDVYLLEEDGINAFAAGHHIHNAAIGVTRGLLTHLNRSELQGVIAHEYSHIFHGDIKLNMRLMSLLFGIVLISMVGRGLLKMGFYGGGSRSRKGNPGAALALLGLGIFIIGSVGVFFARLIQAAISRQREFLADASAVQYTRNPGGIAGALKKIGAHTLGSRLQNLEAQENSHMMFSSSFSTLFATHPPLEERIRTIEPNFDGDFSKIKVEQKKSMPPPTASKAKKTSLNDLFGDPEANSVLMAGAILAALPNQLYEAAHDPYSARALLYALFLDPKDGAIRKKQLSFLKQKEGTEMERLCMHLEKLALQSQKTSKLPLLEISLPALRDLSVPQKEDVLSTLHTLVESDYRLSVFEFSILQILRKSFKLHKPQKAKNLQQSLLIILSSLSYVGHRGGIDPKEAFEAGIKVLGLPNAVILPPKDCGLHKLEKAFDEASFLKPKLKKRLLHAVIAIIKADKEVLPREYELLQTLGICLDSPLPLREA